jgi:hypothetical protein
LSEDFLELIAEMMEREMIYLLTYLVLSTCSCLIKKNGGRLLEIALMFLGRWVRDLQSLKIEV